MMLSLGQRLLEGWSLPPRGIQLFEPLNEMCEDDV